MSNNNDIVNNYEKSIVKIITLDGRIVGTGFIVTEDGIICTCFHNVGDLYKKDVYNDSHVYFPEIEQPVKATILKDEKNREYVDTVNDIAFLQIQKKDQELIPLPLSKSVLRDHSFMSHGFRKSDEFKPGLGSKGDIIGLTKYQKDPKDPETEIPIIQLNSKQVEEGMSGSPVLDIQTKKIIGMITTIYDKKDKTDSDLVMAIPVQSMINLYESLSKKNAGLNSNLINPFSEDNQEIKKILNNYTNSLEKKVSKVRLLGDNKEYDLTEVFVDLIINEEYERPSFQSEYEYKGMMDYELRKKRILFSDYYLDEEKDDKNKEGKDKEKKIKKIKPEDLLKSNKKTTIIVGAPGSGKSTLMRYLVHKILEQKENEYFPVYLELKKIQRKGNDKDKFEDIILSEAIISPSGINDNENEKSILKILRDKLIDGKIAFFLDGLDEMKEADNSHNVPLRDLFNKFVESEYIRNNLVIVTTRPYALQGRFDSYHVQEMEIAPFDIKQTKQFIIHYYGNNNPDAKRFLDALSTGTEIQELARVPLILGFLLQMYVKSQLFSENKLDLYRNIVNTLNNQLDEEKGVRRNFKIISSIHRRKILTNIAFSRLLNFHKEIHNRFIFTEDEILDKATKYCSENPHLNLNADDLFEDIKMTALLREIGNDTYAFTHLTIQEYLAATVLVKDKNLIKLFCQAYFDSTICEMEVLPMTIGLTQSEIDNRNINLYELLEKLPESLNFANLRLCTKGLVYSPMMVDEKHISHIVDRLIEFVAKKNIDETSYEKIILNVFSGLSAKNSKYISQRLLELLRKHDQLGSSFSIENLVYVLGKLNDKEVISALVELLRDNDSDVRAAAAAVNALTGTQDKEAISALVELLKDKESNRFGAAKALTGTQDKKAISALVELLRDNDWYVLTVAAVNALTGTQNKEAISALVELLKDKESNVRTAVAAASTGTEDKESNVRTAVAKALTGTEDKKAISALVELLRDNDSDVRTAAAKALTGTQDKDVISALVELLKDKDIFLRTAAAKALSGTQDKEAISALVELLKDNNFRVRTAAAKALSSIQDKDVISALMELLKDKESNVRAAAAEALTGTQDKEAISALAELLKDKDMFVLASAANALKGTQDKEAISALAELLKDKDMFVPTIAAYALKGTSGTQDKEANSILVELLKGKDPYACTAAVNALRGTQDKEAISALVELLRDNDSDVRTVAANALTGTQDKEAISALVELLRDNNFHGRRTAAKALSNTQGKEAISALVELLRDNDSDGRTVAANALENYAHSILSEGLLMALSNDNVYVRKKSISVIGYYSQEDGKKKLQEIIKNDQNEEIRDLAKRELEKLQFKIQMVS